VAAGPRAKSNVAWFTTWNCRCGIAEYSRHLLDHFDGDHFDWTILASYDDQALRRDDANVIRCWGDNAASVRPLLEILNERQFDVLVLQYKIQLGFGWLSLKHFEALLAVCHSIGTHVVVVAHATDGADPAGRPVSSRMRSALATAGRILVHSEGDVARLRAFGLTNVDQFAHGFPDIVAHDGKLVRARLAVPQGSHVVGAYGFMLPPKGIDTLIEAFAMLRVSGVDATLLLVNALYPGALSQDFLATCERVALDCGVRDHVIFETRFLSDRESAELLSAADVVVFPYRDGMDSCSGAVRVGLASGRPVLCTPAAIFSDVAKIVHVLDGFTAEDICRGLQSNLAGDGRDEARALRQLAWVEAHSWRTMSLCLQEMIGKCQRRLMKQGQGWVGRYLEDLVAVQSADDVAHDCIIRLEQELRASRQASAVVERDLDAARRTLRQVEAALRQSQADLGLARAAVDRSSAELRGVYASRSWRATTVLRYGEALLDGWLRRGQPARAARLEAPQLGHAAGAEPAHPTPTPLMPPADLSPAEPKLSAEARDVRHDLERTAEQKKW